MKILTRYVIKEMLGPLFFGVFAFASMFLGVALMTLLRETEQLHLSFWSIAQLFSLLIPQNLMLGTTIAVLLATLLGLGNLTSHSETIAMRAGGMSYTRLMTPAIVIGLLLSIGGILLNEYVIPTSLRAQDRLRATLANNESYFVTSNFNILLHNGELVQNIYAAQYDSRTQELHDAIITEIKGGKILRTIESNRMDWQNGTWIFGKTRIYQFADKSFYPIVMNRAEFHYPLKLKPDQIFQATISPDRMSMSELYAYIQGLTDIKKKRDLLVEFHSKFAMPVACLAFALLGIPMALKPQRRSSGANFGLCLVFVAVYYLVWAFGTSIARQGFLDPFTGAWLADFLLIGFGIFNFSRVKS